ncbi:MAG: sugar isomerase domain-containing protein [Verrucomicrobiae bacterium]|nr:sugar isomerase domain-containing protein [Verrucomicrobiae bacterium]
MISIEYLKAIRGILDHLEKTQLPAIERAADLAAAALTRGGTIYCSEIGHGIQGDFIGRAGGLMAVEPFKFNLAMEQKIPETPVPEGRRGDAGAGLFDREIETVRLAVNAGNLRAGDVMVTASVSGRNKGPVELTLACQKKGLKVIAFTSMEYTRHVQALHPSGKKLCDVADVVIDNGAPYGDAAVEIPGFPLKLMPVSGVAMDVAGWMIWGRLMEKMAAAGTPPSVWMSVNRKEGPDFNNQMKAAFEKRGY